MAGGIMTRIRLKWNTSRGMPPIFGFLGKVTAKGKKALLNSIVLLALNLVFITGSAFALAAIENSPSNTFRAKNASFSTKNDFKYFLSVPHKPVPDPVNDPDYWINHRPGHEGWTDEHWAELHALHSSRCFKLDNGHTQANLWNFWSSFDFCATVLTTIGYGSMYPRTWQGKWFCLVYSIIGIPIMAMYLALFSNGICTIINKTISLLASLDRSFRRLLTDLTSRVFSLFVLLGALIAFVCMWSAILTMSNPADSFIKCMYFYVITLTTVGLGDISMTEARPFVMIRVLFLFCVGLTLVTSVFNALRSVSAAHTKVLKAKGRKLTNKAQEAVNNVNNRLHKGSANGQDEQLLAAEGSQAGPDQVETTFALPDDREGFNSRNNGNNNGYSHMQ